MSPDVPWCVCADLWQRERRLNPTCRREDFPGLHEHLAHLAQQASSP